MIGLVVVVTAVWAGGRRERRPAQSPGVSGGLAKSTTSAPDQYRPRTSNPECGWPTARESAPPSTTRSDTAGRRGSTPRPRCSSTSTRGPAAAVRKPEEPDRSPPAVRRNRLDTDPRRDPTRCSAQGTRAPRSHGDGTRAHGTPGRRESRVLRGTRARRGFPHGPAPPTRARPRCLQS